MVYIKDQFIKVVSFDKNSITIEADRKRYTFSKSDTVILLADPFIGQLDSKAEPEKFTFDDFIDMVDCCDTKEDGIEYINDTFSCLGVVAIGIE